MKFNFTLLVVGASLLTVVSCGNSKSKKNRPAPQAETVVPPTPDTTVHVADAGLFRANLRAVNPAVNNAVRGTALVTVTGEDLRAETTLNGASANTVVRQYIHNGSACPTVAFDTNADGIVDAAEAKSAYGAPLLALDGDIASATRGEEAFHSTDAEGNFLYSEVAMLKDLMGEIKSSLKLSAKHVVVYGVAEGTELPSTVAASGSLSTQASLPIACGELVKVEDETSVPVGKE